MDLTDFGMQRVREYPVGDQKALLVIYGWKLDRPEGNLNESASGIPNAPEPALTIIVPNLFDRQSIEAE